MPRIDLPEIVECGMCKPPQYFHALGAHLNCIHETNSAEYRRELNLSPDTPLHSRQYSESRSRAAKAKENVAMIRAFADNLHLLREQAILEFIGQGFYTTGQAKQSFGFADSTFLYAYGRGDLEGGKINLIRFHEGRLFKIPGPTQVVFQRQDIENFVNQFPPELEARQKAIEALAEKGLLTTSQASELTGLNPNTFLKAYHRGRLQGALKTLHFLDGDRNRIPGPPRIVFSSNQLVEFVGTIKSSEKREMALKGLSQFQD